MKILISGGTGMVGSELGKVLSHNGHELFVLSRSKEKAQMDCPFPQTSISYEELESHPILSSLDVIVNLAGASIAGQRWNTRHKKVIYNSRIHTTQFLTDLAKHKCPKLKSFISTSAVGIYGNTGDEPIDEDHNKSYGFLGQLCQDWEAPVNDLDSVRHVILRVGIVFSEKGGALSEMVPPIQAGVGGALASGKQIMSWIDIEDLVQMFVFSIEGNLQGTYNAVAPMPATNNDITEFIAKHLGTTTLMNVPYLALRMIVGEMAKHLIESQNISSQKIQDKGFQFKYKTMMESIEKRVPKFEKMMERRLIFEQWIPKTKEDLFVFFSDAKNLEKITPKNLQFKIISTSTAEIQEGTIFKYQLKIEGIPVRWKTLIKDWNPPHSFSDNQEKGPYNKWYHQHFFEDLAGGTLMTDQVDLALPLGPLGHGLASWKVLTDVKKIFTFRRKYIHQEYKKEL